jgi:Trp operon repressor
LVLPVPVTLQLCCRYFQHQFIASTQNNDRQSHEKECSQGQWSDQQLHLVVKCAEARYKTVASEILDNSAENENDFNQLYKVLTVDEYKAITKLIRIIPRLVDSKRSWSGEEVQVDILNDFEALFASLFREFFISGSTIISLDDDKLRKLSRLFKAFGLKTTFTRNNGACPVMHMAVSVATGLILAHRMDRPGTDDEIRYT